jgi:enoyl-CoA hydratase
VTFDNLLFERDGAIAVITLNRPSVLNALNVPLLTDMARAVTAIESDPDVRALVITGAGDKAFAAGADIRELASFTPGEARAHAAFGQGVFSRIQHLQKPVVAALNGFALGGGCELALSCTLRLAAETARIGLPEINLGFIPGFGGTQRLPRLVGTARALDLLLTGRIVSAGEALEMGLVNRVVPSADVLQAARALATELASKPEHAVRFVLEAVLSGMDMPFGRGQQVESALFGLVSDTADAKEGTAAFLEKRAPRFSGQ